MNHEPTIATIREMAETMPKSSMQERMTLLTLAAEEGGVVAVGDLAHRVGTTPGGTTIIIDRLILAGLVERVRDDTADRRYVFARVTKKGTKVVARAESKATDIAAA